VIRVLLLDDHSSFRQPLAFMMQREPDLEVVAQAGSLAEGRRVLKDVKEVDVAVVDLDLPDGNGADFVRDLRTANPQGMVMVLTASKERVQIARAVEAGASGVMHKSASISEIIDAVRRLSEGQPLLSTIDVIEMLRLIGEQRERNRDAQAALGRLTKREREVLQALAEGLNDKEIADRLHISTETARTHMVNILGKLGVDSRLQALVFAVRHGAVKID
jgi:two-component system nitrate/nitrite response regulator NarL